MPEIRLQHVVSCSSEDKSYPAENLLKGDGFKKWRGAKAGEKQVSVTLQFEKAVQIDKIDIGNDGSAFVEVLVGKSSSSSEDFQVILVASAFMNPLDSRAGKNMTSVRMFTADKLSKTVVNEKWDKVKVICTQPFNKTVPYGLAFIKFYSPPEAGSTAANTPATAQSKLGGFKLKADDGDNIKTGSLFSSRDKDKASASPLTGAAAVRAASKLAEEAQKSTSDTPKPALQRLPTTPRDTTQVKRKHDSEERPSSSKRPSIESPHSESIKRQHSNENTPGSSKRPSTDSRTSETPPPLRKQSTSVSSVASSASKVKDTPPSMKKSKSMPTKSSREDFSKLMRKVVMVMSGYQNPERGKIRDKAQEMGAEYRADWGNGCTHLICAFDNTPKYNQVKGKGRIVDKHWILESYKAKKLLPWRKFRVGRAKSPGGSSDSETDEDDIVCTPRKNSDTPKNSSETRQKSPAKRQDSDPYGGETDSGDDTEDEIRRVREAEKKPSPHSPKKAARDPVYDESTDYDDQMDIGDATNGVATNGDMDLPKLPDMFKHKKFMFYGSMNDSLRKKMRRYIVAYNGVLEQYMDPSITYIITEENWDDKFDQALSDNPSLLFVRPEWLYACNQQQKYVPYQKYAVIPK